MRKKKRILDFMDVGLNEKADSVGEVYIYGDISDSKYWDDDVTPREIMDALEALSDVNELRLYINSYGGSVIAGNAMVSIIDRYKERTGAKVVANIEGIAASMASGVAMAADEVNMAQNALFMVHKPWSVAVGNAFDMEHEAEVLDKVEDTLVSNYMRRFNGTEEELRQLMADETWMNADEAYDYGLVDNITEAVYIAASAKGIIINGKEFTERVKAAAMDKVGVKDVVEETPAPVAETPKAEVEEIPAQSVPVDTVAVNRKTLEKMLGGKFESEEQLYDYAQKVKQYKDGYDKYSKILDGAIEAALKSGVSAKGEAFNYDKWKRILNTLSYEDVVDQMHEWEADAKIALKAGKRISTPVESVSNAKSDRRDKTDMSDYQI